VIIAPTLHDHPLQANASVGIQIVSNIASTMAVGSRHRSFVDFASSRPAAALHGGSGKTSLQNQKEKE
jgi:hypothetical protein